MVDIREARKSGIQAQANVSPSKNANESFVTPEENTFPDRAPDDDYGGDATVKAYMEFLEEKGVSRDDIFNLLTSILSNTFTEWGATLFNKIDLRFRMRPSWAEDMIAESIDALTTEDKNMSIVRYSNLVRMYNLAASLAKYNDTTFKMEDEEDFKESLKFVQHLAYPILTKVCDQLAIFDRAIAVATSEWALGTFTKAPKENS